MSTRTDGSSQGPRPTLPPPGDGGAAILGSSSWAECPVVKGAFPWGLAVRHVFSDRLRPWPETSVCPQTYGPFPGPSRGTLLSQASCRGALCREGLPALPRALGLRPGTVCAALRAGQVSPPLPQGPPGSSPSCTPLPWAPPGPPWSGRWDGSAVGLLASHRLSLLRGDGGAGVAEARPGELRGSGGGAVGSGAPGASWDAGRPRRAEPEALLGLGVWPRVSGGFSFGDKFGIRVSRKKKFKTEKAAAPTTGPDRWPVLLAGDGEAGPQGPSGTPRESQAEPAGSRLSPGLSPGLGRGGSRQSGGGGSGTGRLGGLGHTQALEPSGGG